MTTNELEQYLQDDRTVVLDVRTADEILDTGYLKTYRSTGVPHAWLNVSCTATDGPLLEMAAESLIPDPTVPVVVYCRSGRRAGKAKEILDGLGYKNVLNAGGWSDVERYQNMNR